MTDTDVTTHLSFFLRTKDTHSGPRLKHDDELRASEECRDLSLETPRPFVRETKGNRTPEGKTT